MFFGSPIRKFLTARKVISLLVLGCVLFASAPFPIGLKVVRHDAGTPFPCMNCACGCATAEQCWTSCCCFTPAERERWAEEHGVTPPSYAVLSVPHLSAPQLNNAALNITAQNSAAQRGSVLNRLLRNPELGDSPPAACASSHCSKLRQENCASCSAHVCADCDAASPVGSPADAACADVVDNQPSTDSNVVTVISVVALRCQGASSVFTLLPWAIVESGSTDISSPEVIADPYLVCSETAASLVITPATPPPKC